MLGAQPGNLLVAKFSLRYWSAFAVNQQIVTTAQREVLDVRHAFPTARLMVPRFAPHDDIDFIGILEEPIWITHLCHQQID
ncbi:MAG TPA: hypothetical protein VGD41_11065, partial [Pyrinomonadaceae bacterium]